MKDIIVLKRLIFSCILFFFVAVSASAQTKNIPYAESKEFKLKFNEDGSHYVKLAFLNQLWLRHNESNPGTTVFGTPKSTTYDIGLRRTRIQLFGQISDRVFFYTQFGQNNLSYNAVRKQGLYFLDGITEYAAVKDYLSRGWLNRLEWTF